VRCNLGYKSEADYRDWQVLDATRLERSGSKRGGKRKVNTAANQNWLHALLVASVLIHFLALLWHGTAHILVPVPLTALQTAFVGFVIFLLPLIGAGLLWSNRRRTAAWLISLSMLGSLIFGFINHFMRASPDYVLEVPANAWRHSFVTSAALLAVTETIGSVVGAVAVWTWRRTA
jgi:cation transport ATPase